MAHPTIRVQMLDFPLKEVDEFTALELVEHVLDWRLANMPLREDHSALGIVRQQTATAVVAVDELRKIVARLMERLPPQEWLVVTDLADTYKIVEPG